MKIVTAAFAFAVAMPAFPQDDPSTKLREAWPKLQEAWKATTEFKASLADAKSRARETPDEALKIVGQLHVAFEAAGLWHADIVPDLAALKQVFKARVAGFLSFSGGFGSINSQEEYQRMQQEYQRAIEEWSNRRAGRGAAQAKSTPISDFETGAAELLKLKDSGDEDLVQDAVSKMRKALKDLGIMDEETPPWVRVRLTNLLRALALGQPCPEIPKATDEQRRKIDDVLSLLEEGDLNAREDAVKELLKLGEIAVPQARKRYAETADAESKVRLKRILGLRDPKPVVKHACRRCGTNADGPAICESCGTAMQPQK